MPAIDLLSSIKRSTTLSALLTRDHPFASHDDRSSHPGSSFNGGLHPAAIFGIVAGVMLILIVTFWVCWFRLIKKAFFNKQYGVLPSIRTAADGFGNPNRPPPHSSAVGNYPYGGGGYEPYIHQEASSSPYGHGNNTSHPNRDGGDNTTVYPPLAHHHHHHQGPPIYDGSYSGFDNMKASENSQSYGGHTDHGSSTGTSSDASGGATSSGN